MQALPIRSPLATLFPLVATAMLLLSAVTRLGVPHSSGSDSAWQPTYPLQYSINYER